MSEYHVPVLLKESVDGLDIRQGGVYLDLTFGGGGHSGEILKRLDAEGCLLGFDQDEDALANVPEDDRFIFVNHNFRYLRNFMRYYGYEEADGILADLGVSSHEFDEAGRGFSFRFEAELDMRMNQRSKLTAATVLNTYDAEQLAAIFRNYGEVENARRLVDLIVKARANQEIKTSEAFYQIILPCIPKLKEKKYLAKVYQALRIEVNGELEALEEMMQQAMEVLKPGGRLVIITYHSLEDRIVKNFLKAGNAEGKLENLYRSCMEYMNMLEDTDGYMYRYYKSCDAQEKEIISTWTQHVKAVLTDTIGQSEADYAADYQVLYGNGDVSNYNMFREKAQKYEK